MSKDSLEKTGYYKGVICLFCGEKAKEYFYLITLTELKEHKQ